MNPGIWQAIRSAYRADEAECVAALTARIRLDDAARRHIADHALALAREIRRRAGESSGAEAFLRQYGLSSREGVVLMCLAEALLRIPDAATADALIGDKLAGTQWDSEHRGRRRAAAQRVHLGADAHRHAHRAGRAARAKIRGRSCGGSSAARASRSSAARSARR